MGGGTGALDHLAGVLQGAAGAVDDHIEGAVLEGRQAFGAAAVALQMLHPRRHRLAATGEEAELMACAQQPVDQGAPHETGAAHHQDPHRHAASVSAIQAAGPDQGPQGRGWPRRSNGSGSSSSSTVPGGPALPSATGSGTGR